MASPVRILTVPQVRRARKAKWCADCRGRIEPGARYLEHSAYRWTHLAGKCPETLEARS